MPQSPNQKRTGLKIPYQYIDPDRLQAYHLIRAAYELSCANNDELADALIRQVVELFEDVPLDKSGYRRLGEALYSPSGVMTIKYNGESFSVPAPPFDASRSESMLKSVSDKKARQKILDTIKYANYGWFIQRQLISRALGKPIRTKLQPAKELKNIIRICKAVADCKQPEVLEAAAVKLTHICDTSPIGDCMSINWHDLEINNYNRGWTPHIKALYLPGHAGKTHDLIGLNWMEEDALDAMLAIIFRNPNEYHTPKEIFSVPCMTIQWPNCSTLGDTNQWPNANAAGDAGPVASKACKDLNAALEDLCPNYKQKYALEYIKSWSLQAALHVTQLCRMHEALRIATESSEYLGRIVTKAGMLDKNLEIPNGLAMRAGVLASYKIQRDKNTYPYSCEIPPTEKQITKLRDLIKTCLLNLNASGAMNWNLIDPDAAKAQDGDQKGDGPE